jgi:hypothetical protein
VVSVPGPPPPLWGRVVYRVGWVGGENRFGYIVVFVVVLGMVWYLSRCRVAVRCQRRFRKHIGTGSYRFGQRYDTGLIGSGSSTARSLSVRVAVRCQRQGRFACISARGLVRFMQQYGKGLSVRVAVQHKACHRVGSSTVPARVGIRRHIGTESYRRVVFHRHIGAGSCQQGRVPQAYRRGSCQQVGRLQRQQYDASTGSGG